jgi:hypothetical protein
MYCPYMQFTVMAILQTGKDAYQKKLSAVERIKE